MKRIRRGIWMLLASILVIAAVGGCGGNVPAGSPGAAETSAEPGTPAVAEDGTYTSKEEVARYLHLYGKLPSNYITKKEAKDLGWKRRQGKAGQLQEVAPGKSIGGSRFGNYEGQLPEKEGRKYFECDINYESGNRGAERIIFSDDGLIFYTGDHYQTFEQLYPREGAEGAARQPGGPP